MADSIKSAMDAVASKKESLQKAYLDLESHSSALVNFKIQWKELQDHFDHVEELMRKRAQELGIKLEEKSNVKPLKPSVEVKKSPEEKKIYNPDVVWKTPRPAFKSLCEKMDAEGLKKFIVDNKKDQSGLRYEAPGALRSAPRPAELVLKVLEGFYTKDKGGKPEKDVSLFIQKRRAGVLLLETLPAVVEAKDVPLDVKKAAKKVADDWKGKIGAESGEGRENYLEAHAFLQLLASYGIGSEFNDDFLGECVVAVCRRKQAPELCRTLGLTGKMPDIIQKLINSGKHIEAVNFVHAFGLVEKFPPVPLLTAYIKDAKKVSQETAKNGKSSIAAQNDATSKEIAAVKAVIKCIKEHNLESQMNHENLEKRVAQLEKAKADRKRNADAEKSQQTKRPRVQSGGASASTANRTPTTYASCNLVDRSILRPADRVHYPAPVTDFTAYNLPSSGQIAYDRPSQGILGSAYGVGSRSDILPRSQLFPSDSIHSSLYGAGSFGASSNYSSYNLGSGLPPSASSYPSSYLH